MKKIIAIFLATFLSISTLAGCSAPNNNSSTATDSKNADKLNILCTTFPQYDWTREILGKHIDNVNLTYLLDNGVDLHSYQATADDIVKIANCDMLIYVGGESDSWVDDALKDAVNKDMIVINLVGALGDAVKEEEAVEGMEEEHEDEAAGDEHEDEAEIDEHVWLSLKNAQVLCNNIATKLGEIDSKSAADYLTNAKAYNEKLSALDAKYQEAVNSGAQKTVLFGDRFPFRYLVDDYGLSYYAAFAGCSAETEASFETIAFLSKKVDELGVKSIISIEGTQHKIAQTVMQNTKDKNQKLLSLDSMQSITSSNIQNGATYLSIMEKNLEVLKEALK